MALKSISFVRSMSKSMALPFNLTSPSVPAHLLPARGPIAVDDIGSLATSHLSQWIRGPVNHKISMKILDYLTN